MDEKNIVKNIKSIRQKQEISLERLAKLTGLTKGYLSKIENSHKAPPFSTLIKIAYALNTEVNLLIAEDSDMPKDVNPCIIRKNERKIVLTEGEEYTYHYEALAYRKLGRNMEPYIIEGDFNEKPPVSHEGEEFVYILEGSQEFIYDGTRYVLNEGDSIYFESRIPHAVRSLGDKKAMALVVMYSYKRE